MIGNLLYCFSRFFGYFYVGKCVAFGTLGEVGYQIVAHPVTFESALFSQQIHFSIFSMVFIGSILGFYVFVMNCFRRRSPRRCTYSDSRLEMDSNCRIRAWTSQILTRGGRATWRRCCWRRRVMGFSTENSRRYQNSAKDWAFPGLLLGDLDLSFG